jgi:hypothetical protein
LFDRLRPRSGHLDTLRQMGCQFDVWCYWLSKEGHGGPILSLSQIDKLAQYRFELPLDIYFVGEPTGKRGHDLCGKHAATQARRARGAD